MAATGISTGCLRGYEDRIGAFDVDAVEVSGHAPDALIHIRRWLVEKGVQVLNVHAPCPSRGRVLDLAADGERWAYARSAFQETMEFAAAVGAEFVVVHAFYCLPGELPACDEARMESLRSLTGKNPSIAGHRASESYQTAIDRARQNLAAILPGLKRRYPRQRLVIENLNPRWGYGGILLEDVRDLTDSFGGEVGICLDMGHLHLADMALGIDSSKAVAAARDLIWTTHMHQNFGGSYFIDRWCNQNSPRHHLQEFDPHLPTCTPYRASDVVPKPQLEADNSAFKSLYQGVALYGAEGRGKELRGSVPIEKWLKLFGQDAHRIIECDSRYAPLQHILDDYRRVRDCAGVA